MSNLPGPVPTEAATVPIDHGGRFHDPERGLASGPQLRQTNPKIVDRPASVGLGICWPARGGMRGGTKRTKSTRQTWPQKPTPEHG